MRDYIIHFQDINENLDITEFQKEINDLLKKHYLVGNFSELMHPFWREQQDFKGYG
jgi:hypothetical protein